MNGRCNFGVGERRPGDEFANGNQQDEQAGCEFIARN